MKDLFSNRGTGDQQDDADVDHEGEGDGVVVEVEGDAGDDADGGDLLEEGP